MWGGGVVIGEGCQRKQKHKRAAPLTKGELWE